MFITTALVLLASDARRDTEVVQLDSLVVARRSHLAAAAAARLRRV